MGCDERVGAVVFGSDYEMRVRRSRMLVLGWFLVFTMRYVHEKNMFYVGTVQAPCTLTRMPLKYGKISENGGN